MVKLQTMHPSTHLWGELEDASSAKVNLNPSDREVLCRIPRPLKLEGPRIHQPKLPDLQTTKRETIPNNESYVTHGVQLLAYINNLHKIKETALLSRQNSADIPPLPPLSPPNTFSISKTPFLSFNEHHAAKSLTELPPLLNSQSAYKSLRKSVATLAAFHGYDMSTDEALDVLTDATHQFLSKFCGLLRSGRDKELFNGSKCGFPDVVCRVYKEMGHGSILDIRNYYKNCIIAKHKSIGETAEALAFECHHLDENHGSMVDQNGMVMEVDQDDIPEIHFPSSEEGDAGSSGPPTLSLDHNAPQIETGLQMLQSLEQYGSLDPGGMGAMVTPPPPASAQSVLGEECDQPMSHDSNAALLLATVSPGSSHHSGSRKRRKTSDNRNVF